MTRGAITELNSSDRAGWMRAIEAAVRRVLGAGIAVVAKFTAGINAGGASFPSSPATNQQFFRTDKKCWYMWDGAVWQIVGLEQTIQTLSSPSQAFTTGVLTDITGSGTTITTLGTGTIVGTAMVRVNSAAASQVQIRLLINGSVAADDQIKNLEAGETATVPTIGKISLAAGTYTCKLQAALTAGTTVTVVSHDAIWTTQKT